MAVYSNAEAERARLEGVRHFVAAPRATSEVSPGGVRRGCDGYRQKAV
jgi:hypothetical protein